MRLETLLADVKKRIGGCEYVEVDPRDFSDAMKTTLRSLWNTEPGKVKPKALEMAAELGLHFQSHAYPDGRTCILFSRLGSPMSRKTQRVKG